MGTKSKKAIDPPICPCCDEPTQLVTGDALYPNNPGLRRRKFWACFACDAYVGCHPNSDRPLGIPAQKDLRELRKRVHIEFDPIWFYERMTRKEAYAWLSASTKIPKEECHIQMLDESRCRLALDRIAELRRASAF